MRCSHFLADLHRFASVSCFRFPVSEREIDSEIRDSIEGAFFAVVFDGFGGKQEWCLYFLAGKLVGSHGDFEPRGEPRLFLFKTTLS